MTVLEERQEQGLLLSEYQARVHVDLRGAHALVVLRAEYAPLILGEALDLGGFRS